MNRRFFLKSGFASLGICASTQGMANGLGLLTSLANTNTNTNMNDYKTLVCVNLQGGADTTSLFVPSQTTDFNRYKKIRQNLTYDQNILRAIKPININIGDYSMPNFMNGMLDLFDNNKLSIVSNVGPLREPTTLRMIKQTKTVLPPFMGSHNDQENLWQAGVMNTNETSGWGGRIIEALNAQSSLIPSNISLVGSRKLLRGKHISPFTVDPEAVRNLSKFINPLSSQDEPIRSIFNRLLAVGGNSLDQTYKSTIDSALENNKLLKSTLDEANDADIVYPFQNPNPMVEQELNIFTKQLKRAAQLIESAPSLGQHRQIIFLQMNAFDTHDNQSVMFPALMQAVAESLKAFQSDLESRGVDDRVVTFSTSEFGRTMTINSNGTDHGWGGHQFVMGTPVNGGQLIGSLPEFEIDSSDVYENAIIPQYSVEQYAGNLAKWFGINSSQILDIFPNYNRFDDLDFGLFS